MKKVAKILLISIINILLLSYIGLGIVLYLKQSSFLYFPAPKIPGLNLQEMSFVSDELTLHGYVVNRGNDDGESGSKPALIYYGGNGEAIEENADFFRQVLPQYVVYLVPYRGYGGNPGLPSEDGFYQDALNIFDSLSGKHQSFTLMGRSLGSAVATYVAVNRNIDALVLVTPLDSAENIAKKMFKIYPVSILIKEKYLSWQRAGQIQAPTLVLIAKDDEVIPRENADNLIKHFTLQDPQVNVIESTGHNTISFSKTYALVLATFLKP